MKTRKAIIGSGGGGKGGGGGGHVPVESPDSLQSKAFAQVMDLVSEGEIEGLVDGMKSIYLDGVPLENANGTTNFSGVLIDSREGSQDQDYITGFPASENEVSVGVEVKDESSPGAGAGTGAVVRTITNESLDAVRVRVSIPQLTYQNPENGDLGGSEVTYVIELDSDGGGYEEVERDTIIGKSTSKYERQYRVELTGPAPWSIRVRRISADSDSVTTQNKTVWESYTEIVDGKLRYPNSALVAVKVDASQFSSIPTRGYHMRGIKVRIPDNATVRDDGSLEYDGVWSGDFQIAWTTNPAWIFYDIVTASRYGLGSFISEDQVDKWGLYTIGRYCDELVSDGRGGTEPRFSANIYLQTRAEAYQVIKDLASAMRAMSYWAGGQVTVVQDAPADAAHLFTQANVVDGAFTYSGSSARVRHTIALVTWCDPDDMCRQKVEYVEDADGIARFGANETQVVAIGCTSQSQAHRVGRWLLYSEQNETEVVSFKVGLDGALVRPGQIIKVADPMRAGERRGGRIVSATTTAVTVDQDVMIDPETHTLSVLLPTGEVETRNVLSGAGRVITVTEAFSEAPQAKSVWLVSSVDLEAQTFRIIGMTEGEGGVHEITAVAHDPDKYDAIESDYELQERDITSLTTIPDAPTNVVITETLYSIGADVRVKVTCSWNAVTRASAYLVQYQRDSGNVITLPQTTTNEIEVLNAEPGVYTFTVYALNAVGVRSAPSTASKEILGRAAPPGAVQDFSLVPNAGTAFLSWEKSSDLDVLIGGSVRIRFTPSTAEDAAWRDTVDIAVLPGTTTRADVPLMPGTYMAKFVDSSGVASLTEARITTSIPEALALNVVETITESPTFPGAKSSMTVSGFYGGLMIEAAELIDDVEDMIDDLPLFDFAGGVATSGTYEFEEPLDLTEVYTSRVTATIGVSAIDVTDTIDQRIDLIDDWADLDGDFIDDVNVELQLSTTLDDPDDVDAEWTEWKRFFVADYTARAFKFRLVARSGNPTHNVVVSSLSVVVDMPDRVVNMRALVSGAGTYAVTYPQAFKETPAVGITGYDFNSGDYYQISNETRSGFDIVFRNSSLAAVSRNFDVIAKGYGRQAI